MVPLVAALALTVTPIRVERTLYYGPGAQQTLDAYRSPGARRLAHTGIPHRLLVYRGSRHAIAYERDAWTPTLEFLARWTNAAPPGFRQISRGPGGGEIWRGPIPGATRSSMLYVPPGYWGARRYPVVYLLPGMPGSPWSYVKSLSVAAVADTLIAW